VTAFSSDLRQLPGTRDGISMHGIGLAIHEGGW